ncbi:MBOAT family O-acyltransferase [Psychromarinibacter halotolerans]|uniref:Probable alginate O-acetylase AlgI n=1 Tax=Psychromarinibacter halotolerans TaxID=1775175 RepID=A0ABV7GQH9_9RHOB|nr:MBOAT family O-acyltransferase [Psychromarinibacter halotolerans]MDF0595530.1 MBOAT family protein [Psychromarinibacter halotolerans]
MVFPTLQFIGFFAVVLALNGLFWNSNALRKGMLLLASYVFYAAWDPRFVLLMAFVSLVAWGAGLGVKVPGLRRLSKVLSIVAMLGVLAVFKYFDFFMFQLQALLQDTAFARDLTWMTVILPVGISFYTFQAISYVMDVDRGHITPCRNPFDVALYISFFPQLVAGPIVRAAHFLPQLDNPRRPDAVARATAVVLILSGLFKKMVVANYLSVMLVDPAFGLPDGQYWLSALTATLGYAIQIYCDFSGYSDIAIGVALLLGYEFNRNFNQPYRAESLRDFWQRWHISLSTWIRDYLYIPMGGSKGGTVRRSFTLVLTMTLAGLWHGAGWNFILWGFLHGAGQAIERGFRGLGVALPRLLGIVLTFAIVAALWLPFRAHNFADTLSMLAAFGKTEGYAAPELTPTVWGLIAIGFAMNWLPLAWRDRATMVLARLAPELQALILGIGIFALFATAQEGVAPFIYFQF